MVCEAGCISRDNLLIIVSQLDMLLNIIREEFFHMLYLLNKIRNLLFLDNEFYERVAQHANKHASYCQK
jgi:hypothetical protein